MDTNHAKLQDLINATRKHYEAKPEPEAPPEVDPRFEETQRLFLRADLGCRAATTAPLISYLMNLAGVEGTLESRKVQQQSSELPVGVLLTRKSGKTSVFRYLLSPARSWTNAPGYRIDGTTAGDTEITLAKVQVASLEELDKFIAHLKLEGITVE